MNFAAATPSLPRSRVFEPLSTCRDLAGKLADVDIPTVAIAPDGTKSPVCMWKHLQQRVPTPEEIDAMCTPGRGLAWIMKGSHELIDIDDPTLIDPWRHLVDDECPGLLARLIEIETPTGGRHFSYRHGGAEEGNQKLAEELRPNDQGVPERRTLIETRGRGGYALLPGSPPECHPSRRPYRLLQGHLTELPTITDDERDTLLSCARQLDTYQAARASQQSQWGQQRRQQRKAGARSGDDGWIVRPGDEFAAHASWAEILEPAGWRVVGQRGATTLWCRPDKRRGTSATTSDFGEHGVLYVFSSNAAPFEPGESYSPFAAYALLNHDGDFTSAASHLHKQGYGRETERESTASSNGHVDNDCGNASGAPQATVTDDDDSLHLTDLGNAERFAQQRGAYNRYCYEWGQWLTYHQGRWRADRPDLVMKAAKDTVRTIYGEAKDEPDEKKRKAIAAWAYRSEAHQRITAMLALAQSELPLPLAQLNADPWLLNCANGTVNLRTGLLQEHRAEDWLTHQTTVAYDHTATSPVWLSFLSRIFNANDDLISFVQRGLGYSMTASVREQCMFFLYGTGSNGKSTLLGTVQDVLGKDYSMQATSEFLLDKKGGSDHPTERADLFQKRFVSTIEVENGRRMAEALMKQLTGGDRIRARRMRENFWEFAPSHKIWLAANHKPTIKGNDHGVWRRIHMVPFTITIPDSEKDVTLGDKLRAEQAGILAWLVQGSRLWLNEGLNPPQEVRKATAEYRAEMDVLASFLAERCEINPNARIKTKDLYSAYGAWCDEMGERKETGKAFGVLLAERGFEPGKSSNDRLWKGLRLLPTSPTPLSGDDPYPPATSTDTPKGRDVGTHSPLGTRLDTEIDIDSKSYPREACIRKNVSKRVPTAKRVPNDGEEAGVCGGESESGEEWL